MKNFVFLVILTICLPWTLTAQNIDDELYFVSSNKEKAENEDNKQYNELNEKVPAEEFVIESNTPTYIRISPDETTVVVQNSKGDRIRDIDAYNRRYNATDYNFSTQNDTLYIEEIPDDGLDGEWIGGFEGSQSDYEYATRIIRFRNPRYAISISSPLYFDIVYGLNSWDWNVYTDGIYAYAFPTYTNPLWWDWWYNPYYRWGYPYYYGWYYNPLWYWWPPYHYHHHYHAWFHPFPGYFGGGHKHWSNAYTPRRSYLAHSGITPRVSSGVLSTMTRRSALINGGRTSVSTRTATSAATASTANRRVVGTRSATSTTGTNTRTVTRSATSSRTSQSSSTNGSASTRSSATRVYTRQSTGTNSTRSGTSYQGYTLRSSSSSSETGDRTYTRTRSYYNDNNSSSQSTRSYSTSRSYSGSSRSGISSGGSSFRSSSGSSATRSAGGGSRRR